MSFKESIIIPLEYYKRCKPIPKDKNMDILLNKSLPSDVKMKLFDQARYKKKRKLASKRMIIPYQNKYFQSERKKHRI